MHYFHTYRQYTIFYVKNDWSVNSHSGIILDIKSARWWQCFSGVSNTVASSVRTLQSVIGNIQCCRDCFLKYEQKMYLGATYVSGEHQFQVWTVHLFWKCYKCLPHLLSVNLVTSFSFLYCTSVWCLCRLKLCICSNQMPQSTNTFYPVSKRQTVYVDVIQSDGPTSLRGGRLAAMPSPFWVKTLIKRRSGHSVCS